MQVLILFPQPHWCDVLKETEEYYAACCMMGVNTLISKDGSEKTRKKT